MTAVKKQVQRITDNPELVAINKVEKILASLDAAARARVMGYIGQKAYDAQRSEMERREKASEARHFALSGDAGPAVGPFKSN